MWVYVCVAHKFFVGLLDLLDIPMCSQVSLKFLYVVYSERGRTRCVHLIRWEKREIFLRLFLIYIFLATLLSYLTAGGEVGNYQYYF